MTPNFHAAFDRLHRDMRVFLRDRDATFDEAVHALSRSRVLRRDEQRFLDICRSLRNFLAHSHDAVAEQLVRIEIDAKASIRLTQIADRLAGRVQAARFCVPWEKVRCGQLDEHVEPLMAEMIARDFSHVPILSEGVVTAIFDERILFRALASDRIDEITMSTRLGDVVDHDLFDRQPSEAAGVKFVSRRATLPELRGMIQGGERFPVVIVTEHGDRAEHPFGLITAWDVPAET